MKFIYSVILMALLLICTQHTLAQDKIIKGSNTRLGPISGGDEDPIGIPILPCHCFYQSDFGQFDYSLQNSESPELKWFQGQEKAMKKELEQRLNERFNTFEEAQFEFFKGFSPSSLIGHYENQVENYINTNFNYSTTAIKNAQARYRTIQTWRQELDKIIDGKPREHYLGDLKYNNTRIEDLRTQFILANYEIAEKSKFNEEKNKRTNRLTWNNKLNSAKENKAFRTFIANKFVNFYNQLDYRDAIRVMSVYMISDYSNSSAVILPPSHFFNNNIWWPDNQDLTSNMIGVTSNQSVGSTGVIDTPSMSSEAAIFRYAVNSFGAQERNLVFSRSEVKSELEEYLTDWRYDDVQLNLVKETLEDFIDNTPIRFNVGGLLQEEILSNPPTIASIENQIFINKFHPIGHFIGTGYTRFLAKLLSGNHRNWIMEGSVLRSIFGRYFEGLHLLSDEELARFFDIGYISSRSRNSDHVGIGVNLDLAIDVLLDGAEITPINCCSEDQSAAVLAEITAKIVIDFLDAGFNIVNIFLEIIKTDAREGRFVREIMLEMGVNVAPNISDELLGELFKVRKRNRELIIEPVGEWFTPILDVSFTILDLMAIMSPSTNGGAYLAIKGGGRITAKALSDYLKALANGTWKTVNESMSDAAKSYQEHISGKNWNESFEMPGPVKFDGFKQGVLIEAKSGMLNFVDINGQFKPFFTGEAAIINQATRQRQAAGDLPIEWHFEHDLVRLTFENLLQPLNLNIKFIHTPR